MTISASAFLPGGNLEGEAIDDGAWKDQLADGLAVFPNPANEQVTIVLPPAATATAIDVLDAMGKVMLSTEQENASGQIRMVMDVRDLPTGMYLVRAIQGDRSIVKRMMINR